MDNYWKLMTAIVGCFIVYCASSQAHIPSEGMQQLFKSMKEIPKEEDPKKALKDILSVNLSDNLQIGLDKFKAGPLKSEVMQIVDTHADLNGSSNLKTARGYGVQMRFILD